MLCRVLAGSWPDMGCLDCLELPSAQIKPQMATADKDNGQYKRGARGSAGLSRRPAASSAATRS